MTGDELRSFDLTRHNWRTGITNPEARVYIEAVDRTAAARGHIVGVLSVPVMTAVLWLLDGRTDWAHAAWEAVWIAPVWLVLRWVLCKVTEQRRRRPVQAKVDALP